MTETVAVIDVTEVKEEAYDMGFNEFEAIPTDGEEADGFELSHFKDSARWANIILPQLRALAGYDDAGHGTYTTERRIVVLNEPADLPAEGVLTGPSELLNELVELWDTGAYDAVAERPRDPSQ